LVRIGKVVYLGLLEELPELVNVLSVAVEVLEAYEESTVPRSLPWLYFIVLFLVPARLQ
jgi:hypothetical protein